MSYLLTLGDLHSERLEALAKKEQLQATELLEKIVVGYLESRSEDGPSEEQPSPSPDLELTVSKDLFRWDEARGAISFTPANRRVFIVNARSWDAVEHDLFAKLLKGAAPLILEMGNAYGQATALDYRSVTGDPERLATYFEHLGTVSGWGRFSLSGDLAKGSRITVRVSDCVFCGSRRTTAGRTNPCHFMMGVCKGIADTVFGSPHSVQETKCSARGNEVCEFSISRSAGAEKEVWPPGPNPVSGGSWR